jgi:hypothetical protein
MIYLFYKVMIAWKAGKRVTIRLLPSPRKVQ